MFTGGFLGGVPGNPHMEYVVYGRALGEAYGRPLFGGCNALALGSS